MTALREGRGEEYIPFTGQSVGLIGEILPAKAIVEEIVASAEKILAQGPRAHS
jgi:nitronate monooxygenase/enoyl-[acyl-carrier protein] reductase II